MLKKKMVLVVLSALLFMVFSPEFIQSVQARSAAEILRSYVEDFRSDPAAAEPVTFGIKVNGEGGGEWQVEVSGEKEGSGGFRVELRDGLPSSPAAVFVLDLPALRKMESGEINALTAMGRARSSDPAPMDIEFTSGFQPDAGFIARFLPFTFHFWTRGTPETVSFGKRQSREVHGASMVVFYYQEGLRSAWGLIEKGQHVNKDPNDQTNPFPTIFIGIRGRAAAKIGGREVTLQAGQMAFIPAGVSHEVWNPYDEPAEVIILMFGEGA